MNQNERRLGRFLVSRVFFRGLEAGEGTNVFHDMVVLRTREDWGTDDVEYLAMHPSFRPVGEGEMIPVYTATFEKGSAHPTWTESTDTWTRYRSQRS